MDTRYNILYFPNNVDIRLCPKNATVSVKEVFHLCYRNYHEIHTPQGDLISSKMSMGETDRKSYVDRLSYWVDYPFRKKSIRVAIKRDPVKRFLSASNYYIRQQVKYKNKSFNQEWYKRNHPNGDPIYPEEISKSVQEILIQLETRKITDSHFYSQTHYLGHPDDYDLVFDINHLDKLYEFINNNCSPKNSIPFIRRNTSDTYKSFSRTLTENDIQLIKEFYSKDYKRGWYTETSI